MRSRNMLPPIFVIGSGRSGTTWIGDTIASCSGCIPIFEPLHPKSVASTPRWRVKRPLPGPYLRARDTHPEWEIFFDALLADKLSNMWTRQDCSRVPKIVARWRLANRIAYRLAKTHYRSREMLANRYIVKEIRANLMLDWLETYTGGRIVYLIRHPCAVIGSRINFETPSFETPSFEADMEEILCQAPLMSDFLEPFRTTISQASTPVQRHAVLWCVENFIPLSQSGSRDWLFCCYEDFVSDQDAGFRRLFRHLGLEPTSRTEHVKNRVVSLPSHDLTTSRPWYEPLSEAEGEEVLRICSEFGLGLYGRQATPLHTPRNVFKSTVAGHT
jgi:Sulfotransferase family